MYIKTNTTNNKHINKYIYIYIYIYFSMCPENAYVYNCEVNMCMFWKDNCWPEVCCGDRVAT